MKELFDQIVDEGSPAIDRLVTERFQENVELEFKTKSNSDTGDLSKDDRKNLGILLSAFANSMGGLIVWGVGARKNDDGVDCANEPIPIKQLEKFKNEIERAISQAVMPRHEGIRVAMVPSAPGSNAGFLLVHVERSERRPHRCEFGEKQYFKRSGDSSIAMEHYDIEDSFKRMVVPKLGVQFVLGRGGRGSTPEGKVEWLEIIISLKNESLVTARYPYFMIDNIENVTSPSQYLQAKNFIGGSDDVIHPELSLRVARAVHEVRIQGVEGRRVVSHLRMKPIKIDYHFGCYNAAPTSGSYVVSPTEIADTLHI